MFVRLSIAIAALGIAPCALAQSAPDAPRRASPEQIEDSLMSVVEGSSDDREVEETMREGAHLIATRDLSKLTGTMAEAARQLEEAFKDVDPAAMKALRDLTAKPPQ